MEVNCPFCGNNLRTKLISNFYFCEACHIAVRSENDMPCLNIDFYGNDWAKYQLKERYNFTRASFAFKQIKKINGVTNILDIGCGVGILVNLLNSKGYNADGIDSSKSALEFAKLYSKGNFYLASIGSFKPKHYYDLVVATQVLEHLRDPNDFLLKIKNILNVDGYLYIETPNLYSWNKRSIWRSRIGGLFYGLDHRIVYTPKSLANLIERNNFSVCDTFTKTFSPTIFLEIINTIRFWRFRDKEKEYRNNLIKISNEKNSKKLIKKTILINIYKKVTNSFIIKFLLFFPNKISELNNKGNQIVIIAKRKS
jgi:2-polyprenyl-3-methyl-5-hydroxy-6-metoxy-1,4-benzoquinol methylase